MATDVEICNMALSRIGLSTIITSITGEQTESKAALCKLWLPVCLKRLLAATAWSFSTRQSLLSVVTDGYSAEYRYSYRMPDCVRFYRIVGATAPTSFTTEIVFDISSDAVGRLILCNHADVKGEYVVEVPYTALPPAAAEALAWKLAVEISGPLRAEARFMQVAIQMYEHSLNTAIQECFDEASSPKPAPKLLFDRRIFGPYTAAMLSGSDVLAPPPPPAQQQQG